MSLPPAAAAALGVQPRAPRPDRIVWVEVEDAPRMVAIIDPSSGEPLGHYAQFEDDLPLTDRMADKARTVCDVPDASECEASRCESGPKYAPDGERAGATIGWVLAGEADERTEWRPFALVQRGREVIAVCIDCSPATTYEALWPTTD